MLSNEPSQNQGCHFDRSNAQGEISPSLKGMNTGLFGEGEISRFARNDDLDICFQNAKPLKYPPLSPYLR